MTTKEELQEQLKVAVRKRKETQKYLKTDHGLDLRHVDLLKQRVKRLRGEIENLRNTLKKMPASDLQKPVPATMPKEEFKKGFRDAVGVQQEPISQIKLDSIEDLDRAWPNIKGQSIIVEAPEDVKAELMRRWREEFNTIKVDGYRPVKMND